jgi:ADP-ribose pyrophosphatase YjhB (NUDIX family)
MSDKKEAKTFINLGIIVNKRDEALMIRRVKKETGRDGSVLEWAFPGGKQRFEESREECVEREVLDETGYEIESIKQISLRMHPQIFVFIVYHLCKLRSEKPIAKPKEPHEIAEIKWVKTKDIRNLITTDLDKKVAQELEI